LVFCLFGHGTFSGLAAERIQTLPVSEIRPGMRGTTLTVLQGTSIVPLETEILGVGEDHLGPGKDLIIAKLVDERTRLTGAVHGMSGSPLYVEGKLVGALSRRIAVFEKDGHCGFTPIADMLEVANHPATSPVARGTAYRENLLSLPITVSGLAEVSRPWLTPLWDSVGLMLGSGDGGGMRRNQPGSPLEPGAPMGVAIATGDIAIVSTGTCTWREGNRVLGFGHPMEGLGSVNLPIVESTVITTVPSFLRPYKMTNSRRIVGTLLQDRLSAVAGVLGPAPEMPPYRIKVRFDDRPARQFEGGMASHEKLIPPTAATLLATAIMNNDEIGSEVTVQVRGEAKLRDVTEPLRMNSDATGELDAVGITVFGLASRLFMVFDQNAKSAWLESMNLDVTIRNQRSGCRIESLSLTPQAPRAGQSVEAVIRLVPWRGEPFVRRVPIHLPEELRPGTTAILAVASADMWAQQDFAAPRRVADRSEHLADVVAALNKSSARNTDLVARILISKPGLRVDNMRQEQLPPSVIALLRDESTDQLRLTESVILEERIPMETVLSGSLRQKFTLDPAP
jgi:hypothetical protein